MAEKVLIVDDDLDTLRLVGLLLERQGYQIIAADNGKQAIAKTKTESPDIILLDVMMPDLDGLEVARLLREEESTKKVPIIFFTAKTQVDDKIAGFEAGADDYLTKPVHPAELTARVKAILARSGKAVATQPEEESPSGKVIGVIAARGGLGVTTIALNLGIVLHKESQEPVVVAELRPGQGTIGMDLGVTRSSGIVNLLQRAVEDINQRDVEMELLEHSSGIQMLLASHQPSEAQYMTAVAQADRIVKHLANLSRYTILDLGPSLPPISEQLLDRCAQIIVVVEPIQNAVTQTKALLEDIALRVLGLDRISVAMVSRVRSELKLSRTQIQEQLGHAVPYVITPVPELAVQAARAKVPMVMANSGNSDAQQHGNLQQFRQMAQAIIQHGQKISV